MDVVELVIDDAQVGTPWRIPRRMRRRRVIGNAFPGFRLERQRQRFWCWAAVSQGIAEHLEKRVGVSQIQMAFEILQDPAVLIVPEGFNLPERIDKYWLRRGRLVHFSPKPMAEVDVQRQVGKRTVVVATIQWNPGDNYFVVVSGWFKLSPVTDTKLIVHDSDPGLRNPMSYLSYNGLRHAYRCPKSRWIQSSLMRSP